MAPTVAPSPQHRGTRPKPRRKVMLHTCSYQHDPGRWGCLHAQETAPSHCTDLVCQMTKSSRIHCAGTHTGRLLRQQRQKTQAQSAVGLSCPCWTHDDTHNPDDTTDRCDV
jgi:hypothetical protein